MTRKDDWETMKANTDEFKSEKIVDIGTAAKRISELKRQNKKAGLCAGGFDFLHPGHIKHFESAKKLCDCLFVSVTSDRFVAARKGSGRPIFSEKLRAYSVASIEYVDYVFISDLERATEVIEKLKPSYYIKGPDFIGKTTPGITAEREAITSAGGEIRYTNDEKLSTTDVIRYIQEKVKREKLLLGIDRDGTLIENVPFLGKEKLWEKQIRLKKDVTNLISYVQTKYDTVKVVISNQQGVARGYFGTETVEKVNRHIGKLLKEEGIAIDSWQYCPDADASYAALRKEVKFNPDFVKKKTRRKPSPSMLLHALQELRISISDFDKVVIIGDSEDDALFAKNVGAAYIDVTCKNYAELKKEFDRI
ncbi:HAD-IIIA family hydrolase [Candidatus Woesearchaeota archaeon]|nr:HAD-IIIA family hydrolase [Candidatus Woesearchaeota archaeon]